MRLRFKEISEIDGFVFPFLHIGVARTEPVMLFEKHFVFTSPSMNVLGSGEAIA